MKKNAWRYHFTLVYHKLKSWCIVSEIWSTADRICSHFGSFFALLPPKQPGKSKFWKNEKNTGRYYHFTHVCHKWKSYDLWFLGYGAQSTDFFSYSGPFFTLFSPNNPENLNFEKMKKASGHVIILHMCTINKKSYDIYFLRYGTIFSQFGPFFALLSPNQPGKSKFWNKDAN